MISLDCRCPNPRCTRLLARRYREGLEIKCKGCGQIVQVPVTHRPAFHVTYECSNCKRRQHVERPVGERTYCIVCGTQTLQRVADVRTSTAAGVHIKS